jgi:PleD family two-component response regulator
LLRLLIGTMDALPRRSMSTHRTKTHAARRWILVVDPAVESRLAAVDPLVEEGYDLVATGSMDAACALVSTGRPDLVLVNLSAFSVASLTRLGQALSSRGNVRILGLVSHHTAGGPPVSRVVRLPDSHALIYGLQSPRPN